MKTKAILLAVLLSFGMIFSSCHKEDDPEPKSTNSVGYTVDAQEEETTKP